MQKKSILWAVFIASGLMLLWDVFSGPRVIQKTSHPTVAASSSQVTEINPQTGITPPLSASSSPAISTKKGTTTPPVIPPQKAEVLRFKTDVYEIEINTRGATLAKLELSKHKYEDKSPVLLANDTPEHKQLIESGLLPREGSLPGLPNDQTIFKWISTQTDLNNQDHLEIKFEAQGGGVKLIKTYVFQKGKYDIILNHTIENESNVVIQPYLYEYLTRDGNALPGESSFFKPFKGIGVYSEQEHYQKISYSDVDKDKQKYVTETGNGWVAQVQHYFVVALTNQGTRENIIKKIDTNYYEVGQKMSLSPISPKEHVSIDSRIYAGPQTQKELAAFAPGLDVVVDYGWLTILAKPLFWLLGFLQSLIHNWGWTIIALTLLIKLVFFPLSASGYRSMARMREITPKLMQVREQYKDDRIRQQQEMMQLYQKEKINPLGGCLPMIIPIPVFLALYWVLLGSVELRNASWLWIPDLSSKDPWYILPVLMAITSFIQTKLSPPPTDPLQAKMMMFMPLIFSVMFIWFPAGLVLYWVVNNLFSIGQQWWVNRSIDQHKVNQKIASKSGHKPLK